MDTNIKKINFIAFISSLLTERLCVYAESDEIKKIKMMYGLEVLILMIIKTIIIFIIINIIGIGYYGSIFLGSFLIIRSSGFGIHLKNSIICVVYTCIVTVLAVYIANYLEISNIHILFISIIYLLAIYNYAPADTKKHPILSRKKKIILRNKTLINSIMLTLIAMMVTDNSIKVVIILAVLFEVVNILPITYKLMEKE